MTKCDTSAIFPSLHVTRFDLHVFAFYRIVYLLIETVSKAKRCLLQEQLEAWV